MAIPLPSIAYTGVRPLPYVPPETISNILQFYLYPARMDDLGVIFNGKTPGPAYTEFKATQSQLASFMTVNKMWYYASKPHVYRNPLLASGDALDSFSRTIAERPDLANYVRSLTCLPFSTTHGQPARKTFPQIKSRANIRLEHGSYAALVKTLKACTRVDTIGLRFIDISSVLTLATFLNEPPTSNSLRSISLCGSCFNVRHRRRLELGRVLTPHLHLPNLEELSLENFFVSPRYEFSWPNLPKLRKLAILRTWFTRQDVHIIPVNLPELRDLALGLSSADAKRVLQYIGHYANQLERLHIVGSSIWREATITLEPCARLRELVLESTACGFSPPLVVALPQSLEKLVVNRSAIVKESDVAWADMLHRALHANRPRALRMVRISGFEAPEGQDNLRICIEKGCISGAKGGKFLVDVSGLITATPATKNDWYWW